MIRNYLGKKNVWSTTEHIKTEFKTLGIKRRSHKLPPERKTQITSEEEGSKWLWAYQQPPRKLEENGVKTSKLQGKFPA